MMISDSKIPPSCNGEIENNGFFKGCNKEQQLSIMEEEDENYENISGDQNQVQKNGKPPRNGPVMRHCISHTMLAGTSQLETLGPKPVPDEKSSFLPVFRSGSSSEIGPKQYMEDKFVCVDDLHQHLDGTKEVPYPAAFYGVLMRVGLDVYFVCVQVFDGHGGVDAASFTRNNLLKYIVEDPHFPTGVNRAIRSAFLKTDHALADARTVDSSSGTTVLTALVLGRKMIIANAGDSRAVLGKRGRAIELSKDHKPNSTSEKQRIERLGGVIYDGYLNGQLSVARALGDWHMKGPKGSSYPLSSEPELKELVLTEEDEFLIIGCDGLWDVMSSQYAVTIVRKELMLHNNTNICSETLVKEALKCNSCDNLTVVVICFSAYPPPPIQIPKSERKRSISVEGLDLLKGVLSNI